MRSVDYAHHLPSECQLDSPLPSQSVNVCRIDGCEVRAVSISIEGAVNDSDGLAWVFFIYNDVQSNAS